MKLSKSYVLEKGYINLCEYPLAFLTTQEMTIHKHLYQMNVSKYENQYLSQMIQSQHFDCFGPYSVINKNNYISESNRSVEQIHFIICYLLENVQYILINITQK